MIDDIPDDLMLLIERRAAEQGRTVKGEMRLLLEELFRTESPLP